MEHAAQARDQKGVGDRSYLFRHTGYPVSAHYARKHPEYEGVEVDGEEPGPLHVEDAKKTWVESVRHGAGRLLALIERLANDGAPGNHAAYIAVWDRVRAAIDAGVDPDAIGQIIESAHVPAQDKAQMLDNVRAIRAAHEARPAD